MTAPGPVHRRAPRAGESGIILVWAIIALAVMAVVAIAFSMMATGTLDRSRSKSDRALTYPHVQSAITKLSLALQSDLASDRDSYVLAAADLASLAPSAASAASVVAGAAELPASYRSEGGIWDRRDPSGLVFTRVGSLPISAYHEPTTLSPAQCAALSIPAASCGTNMHAWWQVYRIELPDRVTARSNGQVVFYVRTWIGSPPPASLTTRPSDATVVRIAMRPGRFADYQLISDGSISFQPGATVSGPIHSNGFDTADAATGGAVKPWGIELKGGVTCTSLASLSTARKSIVTNGASCPTQQATNRFINFLRVQTQIEEIELDETRYPDIHVFDEVSDPLRPPLDSAWHVRLAGTNVRVRPPGGAWTTYPAGSGNGAMLFRDDVVIEGGDLRTRFTIAASRPGSGGASIFIEGNVNENVTAEGQTLGLIAQGDVVLSITSGCTVDTVRAAMVAASGGLTIPPEYATQQEQASPPRCPKPLQLIGSVAGHRPPLLYWEWWDGSWTGYKKRSYEFDRRLLSATPPYFPITGTWQATSIRDANVDCYAGGRIADARCS